MLSSLHVKGSNFLNVILFLVIFIILKREENAEKNAALLVNMQDMKNNSSNESHNHFQNVKSQDSNMVMMRCYWQGDSKVLAKERLDTWNANICPEQFCLTSETSLRAHSDFLVLEALAADKGLVEMNATFQRLVKQKAQCLFWELTGENICSCGYSSFQDFCHKFIWDETKTFSLDFIGDSTANNFRKGAHNACDRLRREMTPHYHLKKEADKRQESEKNDTSRGTAALPRILLIQDMTLHKLYLPYFRESDIQCNTCNSRMLWENPKSVQDFVKLIDTFMQTHLSLNANTLTLIVYMGNKYVCDHLFRGGYFTAVRSLLENPNVTHLEESKHRRKVDWGATLGLTLDYYGSQFANQISHRHFLKLQQNALIGGGIKWAYLPFPEGNLAMCSLSNVGDGRHYTRPMNDDASYSFYVAKARMLHHVIANSTRTVTGTVDHS